MISWLHRVGGGSGVARHLHLWLFLFGTVCVFLVLRYALSPDHSSSPSSSSSSYSMMSRGKTIPDCPYIWHGGSPSHKGSCWCGAEDQYCMCTPSLAIDAIIEYHSSLDTIDTSCEHCSIVLVFRKDPPREFFAIPGGFVNIGETVEQAAQREVHEETNLSIHSLHQFKMFSDPSRDSRRHTASIVFRCIVTNVDGLKGGDDAKAVKLVPLKEVLQLPLAFDHRTILYEYIDKFHPTLLNKVKV